MGGYGSGGANRLSVQQHIERGSLRPARHLAPLAAAPPPADPVSAPDRRRTLDGLTGDARRLVARLMDEFTGWDPASLHTLHQYGLSCAQLVALAHDDDERRSELRVNLALLRSLQLERAK